MSKLPRTFHRNSTNMEPGARKTKTIKTSFYFHKICQILLFFNFNNTKPVFKKQTKIN